MDRALQNIQDTVRQPVYDINQYRPSDVGTSEEQMYMNCYPAFSTNLLTGEKIATLIKRPGMNIGYVLSPTIDTYFSGGDAVTPLTNMVMTQLYDVNVAAFYDTGNNHITLIMYRPITGTTISIGTITTTGSRNDYVFITEITQGDGLVPGIAVSYMKSDKTTSVGAYATSTSGVFTTSSLTTISSGSFPTNLGTAKVITGPFQFLDGINYIMTVDGYIYGSSLTTLGNPDVTTWNTLTTVTASQYPDSGIGLFRQKSYLMAFGQDSVEFFTDVSNAPPKSSLERTDQAFIKFGTLSPKMVINIDDQIYWIAYSSAGTSGVWTLNGLTPVKLTSDKEDSYITTQISVTAGVTSFNSLECLFLNNKKHLAINGILCPITLAGQTNISLNSSSDTFPFAVALDIRGGILCYNIDDQLWWGLSIMDLSNGIAVLPAQAFPTTNAIGNQVQYCFRRPFGTGAGKAVSSSTPFSFAYADFSAGTFKDVSPQSTGQTIFPVTISFNLNTMWFGNERRKRFNKLKLIMDVYQPPSGDTSVYSMYYTYIKAYGLISNLSLFSSYINQRRVVMPLDTAQVMTQRYYISNLGAGRAFLFNLTFSSMSDFRLHFVEMDVDQGSH